MVEERGDGLNKDGSADDRTTLTDAEVLKVKGPENSDGADKTPPQSTGSDEWKVELKTHHANGLVDQTAYLPPRLV